MERNLSRKADRQLRKGEKRGWIRAFTGTLVSATVSKWKNTTLAEKRGRSLFLLRIHSRNLGFPTRINHDRIWKIRLIPFGWCIRRVYRKIMERAKKRFLQSKGSTQNSLISLIRSKQLFRIEGSETKKSRKTRISSFRLSQRAKRIGFRMTAEWLALWYSQSEFKRRELWGPAQRWSKSRI